MYTHNIENTGVTPSAKNIPEITTNNIYLSGGRNQVQSFLIDKSFLEKIPKSGKLLYIPIALRKSKLYPTAHVWMRSVLDSHTRQDISCDRLDDPRNKKIKDILPYDAIYATMTDDHITDIDAEGFVGSVHKNLLQHRQAIFLAVLTHTLTHKPAEV